MTPHPGASTMPPALSNPTTIILAIVGAGIVGEVLFELYAWLISPILFDASLQPARLVIAIVAKLTGIEMSYAVAFGLHSIIGAIGFGSFVYLIRHWMPGKVFWVGVVSGLVLWFVAQGILAPFIGRSFMMGFGPYTQSSFIGHVGMTLVMSYVMNALFARVSPNTPT